MTEEPGIPAIEGVLAPEIGAGALGSKAVLFPSESKLSPGPTRTPRPPPAELGRLALGLDAYGFWCLFGVVNEISGCPIRGGIGGHFSLSVVWSLDEI